MKRRDFIALLGSAAALWPLAARAQQPKRIGVLMYGVSTNPRAQVYMRAFAEQLRKLGWVEGQNLRIEYRWDAGDPALTRTYAGELVALAPDVILSVTTNNLVALQRLSPATPIIFVLVSDPITQGFVLNMAHPGANITGFTQYEFTLGGKWLDLLKQMVPAIDHVAVMFNPETAPYSKFFMSSIESAAKMLNVSVVAEPVRSEAEIEPGVAHLAQQPNGGLIVPNDPFMVAHRKVHMQAAMRYRVPAINADAEFVREGGLMSYYAEIIGQFRQARGLR